MAYTLPVFNLVCKICTGPYDTLVVRSPSVPCNLAMGRRVIWGFHDVSTVNYGVATATLLVPAGTDIRDNAQLGPGLLFGPYDIVEVPAGSGRWYSVNSVDDIGKGFTNEHRFAGLSKLSSNSGLSNTTGLFWPVPMP